MALPDPAPVFDAFRQASAREAMPTAMGSAEIRQLGAQVLGRSVFTARGTSTLFVSKIKEVVDQLAAGNIGEADARVTLLETLKGLGYTPEGGFPDDVPGTVPPALKGTLQDLSSFRRLDLIVRTQLDLMRGAGQQSRGHSPARLEEFPAWELVREEERDAKRNWGGVHDGTPPERAGHKDPRPRWTIAGGTVTTDARRPGAPRQRLIALKADPVWGELGSSGNFDDALDVDHPPFAFNSGMGWREVSRADCEALGITGPGGVSIDDFLRGEERPRTISGPLPMPAPRLSMKDVDPGLLKQFQEETKATPTDDGAAFDYSDLLQDSLDARAAEYAERSGKP